MPNMLVILVVIPKKHLSDKYSYHEKERQDRSQTCLHSPKYIIYSDPHNVDYLDGYWKSSYC